MATNEFTRAAYQQGLGEHRLMGSRCLRCGSVYLPPRGLCRACHSDEMEWVELNGVGKLLALTTIHIAPTAMLYAGYGRENPYCAGIVRLEDGPAISAQILGVDASHPEAVPLGTPCRVEYVERPAGEGVQTFLAFRLE